MKRKELERQLKRLGWWKDREGGSHSIWTNGMIKEPVPRHGEIKEMQGVSSRELQISAL